MFHFPIFEQIMLAICNSVHFFLLNSSKFSSLYLLLAKNFLLLKRGQMLSPHLVRILCDCKGMECNPLSIGVAQVAYPPLAWSASPLAIFLCRLRFSFVWKQLNWEFKRRAVKLLKVYIYLKLWMNSWHLFGIKSCCMEKNRGCWINQLYVVGMRRLEINDIMTLKFDIKSLRNGSWGIFFKLPTSYNPKSISLTYN